MQGAKTKPAAGALIAALTVGAFLIAADASRSAEPAAPDAAPPGSEYVPRGPVAAQVMGMVGSRRAQELGERFQRAIGKDPDWWFTYVRESPPGDLPYHPKFGISEAEYVELQRLQAEASIAPLGVGIFEMIELRPGVFEMHVDSTLVALDGIQIDFNDDAVRTPFGTATVRSAITASSAQRTGPWDGVQWKLEEGDVQAMEGHIVRFCLGRLRETGRGILYYDAKRVENGVKVDGATMVLTYDLSQRPGAGLHRH